MSELDILAEVDGWLALMESAGAGKGAGFHTLKRARDEIVALRDQQSYRRNWDKHTAGMIRAEALQEAAHAVETMVCDPAGMVGCWEAALVIRALKE